jgi:hypothetical protein
MCPVPPGNAVVNYLVVNYLLKIGDHDHTPF